jgi:RHS repeat-associated protein
MNWHSQTPIIEHFNLCCRADNCTGFDSANTFYGKGLACIKKLAEQDENESDLYFYHSDHIGSSSFITDASGIASQHLQYLPFGELFVEQRSTANYYTPYKFSGKEKDEETSYSYFGARYYLSDISIWASVDPMAEDAPGWTPYRYCFQNPIRLIDPDGMSEGLPDHYFGKDGKELGDDKQYGSKTDNIRIIDEKAWTAITNSNISDEKKLSYLTNSNVSKTLKQYTMKVDFHDYKSTQQFKVIAQSIANYYYKVAGYSTKELENENIYIIDPFKDGFRPAAYGCYGSMFGLPKGKYKIALNIEDFGDLFNSKWDFINTYSHERGSHGADFKRGIPYNEYSYEQRAYRFQMNHSSWKHVSPSLRKHIQLNALDYNIK